jgi:tetratricopeptide (TPR) repeat protein
MRFLRLCAVALALVAAGSDVRAEGFDWERAVSLYKQGQYRPAIAEFQRVVAEFPNHSDSWKFIGLAYYQLQEYQSAIAPLEKALSLKQAENKTDPDLHLALGRTHIALKQYDRALPYLETVTKLRPDVAPNHYMLGVVYSNLNRPDAAAAAFQKAVKLAPGDADAYYYLGVQQYRAGRLSEAIATLRQGAVAAPKNLEILGLLSEALLRQGAAEANEARATALYEEAVKTATQLRAAREDAASLELLGRAYLAAKKYPLAEQTLARALTLTRQPAAPLHYNLGLAYVQTKNWARASEAFEAADKLNPRDVNTLYYLGFVYENLRRFAPALDAYTRAWEASGRTNADLKASIDRVAPFAKPQ